MNTCVFPKVSWRGGAIAPTTLPLNPLLSPQFQKIKVPC